MPAVPASLIGAALFLGTFVWTFRRLPATNTPTTAGVLADLDTRLRLLEDSFRRDQYSLKRLATAIVYENNETLFLVKLDKGEFAGQWQFPGGYVDPANLRDFNDPKLKAEREIHDSLGIDAGRLTYLGTLTADMPFVYDYSNRGVNHALIHEFKAPPVVSQELRVTSRFVPVQFKDIEAVVLDAPIALYVYDVLARYKGVRFTPNFERLLDEQREARRQEYGVVVPMRSLQRGFSERRTASIKDHVN